MIASVSQALATSDAAARHHKLVDAAQQFEAMFLQQLLKSAAPDGESQAGETSGADDSGAGNTYKGFGTEAVAKAIAAAGGMGIARQIVRQVERAAPSQDVNQKSFATALKFPPKPPI